MAPCRREPLLTTGWTADFDRLHEQGSLTRRLPKNRLEGILAGLDHEPRVSFSRIIRVFIERTRPSALRETAAFMMAK